MVAKPFVMIGSVDWRNIEKLKLEVGRERGEEKEERECRLIKPTCSLTCGEAMRLVMHCMTMEVQTPSSGWHGSLIARLAGWQTI
jgi:hypothetical protein